MKLYRITVSDPYAHWMTSSVTLTNSPTGPMSVSVDPLMTVVVPACHYDDVIAKLVKTKKPPVNFKVEEAGEIADWYINKDVK